MENNMDNDVKDILALLNQGSSTEKQVPKITAKKSSPKKNTTPTTEKPPSVNVEKKAVGRGIAKSTFLADRSSMARYKLARYKELFSTVGA